MFSIYQITNTLNGHSYIGFTEKTVDERWNSHKQNARNGIDYYFYRAIRKYGHVAFCVTILEGGWDPKIGKDIREPYWISVLKPEYNMTHGGDGIVGLKHSNETKEKLSVIATQQWKNKESREKLRVSAIKRWSVPQERKAQSLRKMGALLGTTSCKVSCPHCNKSGGVGPMKRWHFNNCKKR